MQAQYEKKNNLLSLLTKLLNIKPKKRKVLLWWTEQGQALFKIVNFSEFKNSWKHLG